MNWRMFSNVPLWSVAVPVVACAILALSIGSSTGWVLLSCAAAALLASVVTAVHHAEVIAHRVGEPFGTLVLALAVTVIEVSLIVSMMRSAGSAASTLARDAVFATVMIICNGVVGLCLLAGSLRHHVLAFRVEGTTPALAVLTTLTTLTLVLPTLRNASPSNKSQAQSTTPRSNNRLGIAPPLAGPHSVMNPTVELTQGSSLRQCWVLERKCRFVYLKSSRSRFDPAGFLSAR